MKQLYPFQQNLERHFRLLISLAFVIAIYVSISASSAVASAPLSQLVDDNAGIYIEATDLNSHVKQFLASPLVTRFRQSHVFQSWLKSQDVKNLKQGLKDIESITQQPLLPLLNKIFGKSFGLAIFNNGPKQNPSFLFLTSVKDPANVQSLFENWSEKIEVSLTPASYQNIPYYVASHKTSSSEKSSPQAYYGFLEGTLIASENEKVLQSAIDLYVNQNLKKQPLKNQACIFNLKMYQRAQSVLSQSVAGSVFLNPRIWDEHIQTPKNDVERGVFNWWKKTGGFTVGLHLQNTVALEAVILFDSEAINLPLLDILRIPPEIPNNFSQIPKNALAVVSGQLNVHLLTQKIIDFYADKHPEKWQKIHAVSIGLLAGLDPVTELSKTLGPNFLFYSIPREELSFDAIAFDGLVALELSSPDQETNKASKPQYQIALENVVHYLMNSMITDHNAKLKNDTPPSILRIENHDLYEMRWIEGLGLYQPAYGINGQQIVFASSPELIKEFFTLKSEESLAALPLFQTWKETFFQEENQLCFLNISSIRTFIDENSDFLAKQLAKGQGGDIQKGQQKLSGLKSILESFDGIFFAAGLQKSQVRVIIGLGSLDTTN
ncbi:DUF3352 domain-containing protein [Gimesia aquarii]|uniref:DUF3352 domain-containing protein n=1 Tax=Gimesia aquarii TaxID=2527964 RepID=A0A517W1E9_9PLAN|nr:DUF3352 domain-containing protein [Gimesia aquarii]QDT99081.1 hypothetical protein V144x_45910 [Gimesia aquarii]